MSAPSAATVIGLGCATPQGVSTQARSARFAVEMAGLGGDARRFAESIYARSGIASRASALLNPAAAADGAIRQSFYERASAPEDRGPTTAARMRAYAALAPALAGAAAERALIDAAGFLGKGAAAAITHLVVVSCTGFSAPGLDVTLIRTLGLSPTVERLTIGFMGCHGGVVGLRTARALAMAAPPEVAANVLVVCVELCSLHFQYGGRPDQIVANALFGDGAAAAVVSNQGMACNTGGGRVPLVIRSAASRVFPASEDAMGWTIGDHGFEMTLRESVPDLIRSELGPWLRAWLESCGIAAAARERVLWAVHPGGPRVLQAVGDTLGLSASDLSCSRAILHDHGNMSSPTVLFVIARLLGAVRKGEERPIVALGFGPGLTAEAVLLGTTGSGP